MLQMEQKRSRRKFVPQRTKNVTNFKGNKKFSWTKVPYRTKNFRNENCSKLSLKSWFQSETKTLIYAFLAICWHVRQHGLLRNNMSLSDLLWSCMEFYGLLWSCVALYRRFMVFHGFVSLFSRGHRSKFIWSCFFCEEFENFCYRILLAIFRL